MMAHVWWKDLHILAAVESAGSMSKAAKLLGIDKATVSRRMRELASQAPAPLFEPRARALALTAYGMRAMRAHRALEQAHRVLLNELEPNPQDVRGNVRLSLPSFFATDVVVPALAGLSAQHPTIAVKVDASNRVVDIASGEADLALRNVRPTEPSLSSRVLGRLGLAVYASRNYLAARGEPKTRDLRGHDLVVYDTGPYSGPGFEWLPEAARSAHVTFAANDACALREAARAGLGLTVLPHCIGDKARDLRRIPGLGEGSTEILLITRSRERQVPRIRAVASFLADLVRTEQSRLLNGARAARAPARS